MNLKTLFDFLIAALMISILASPLAACIFLVVRALLHPIVPR
jgi:hypothetical protein